MSAYNEVIRRDEETCPRCGSSIHRPVQFKYGDTWQHQFAVGDRIAWGGNDIGEPGHKLVVVLGDAGECPICGHVPDGTYDIMIEQDVITGVDQSDGTYDYVGSGETYIILES